ncbi:MarR family winged helix-turn-helix transcriptional regulator [Streptomyces sp. cg35]|uniref:MarR family winged helix-turn-helix transcriptional regulator n=1 Tax=Streptomyces sp. cg35 TaxID=3421650 RepID=UPI003D1748DA
MDSDGPRACAGPLQDARPDLTAETVEAVEALVSLWARASRTVTPQLSVLQLQALLVAREVPRINLSALAEEVGAAPSAASRLCNRLEAAGLLRREPATTSRREIQLVLTRQGNDILDTLSARRARMFGDVLSRMPAASRQELLTGLRAFAETARTQGRRTTDRP